VRIGFDVTGLYYARAGVLSYRWRLLQALLREGHAHEFVLLNYLPLTYWLEQVVPLDSIEMPNVRIVTCKGIKDRKLTRWPLMTATPRREKLARRVDNWLEPFWERIVDWSSRKSLDRALAGADVFHCSTHLLYKPRGVCVVVTVHDLSTLICPEFHLRSTVELHERKLRFVREQADLVIAVSENTRRDVMKYLGVPPDKVHVVYEAAGEQFQPVEDANILATATRRYGVEPGRYLLHVGTLEPRKNLMRLVRAFALVYRQYPDYKLMLVGRKGWLYEDIFAEVERLDLQSAVVFAGFVPEDDLPPLMSGAALFVYPSLYEGFGLPVLEAMACGAPVITSNCSSLPEVVGDAGLLVDPEDESALSEALITVLSDEARRQEMSRQGISRAMRFSWKEAARQTLKAYRRVSENHRGEG